MLPRDGGGLSIYCVVLEVCYQCTGGGVSSLCVGLEVCYKGMGEGYPHSM